MTGGGSAFDPMVFSDTILSRQVVFEDRKTRRNPRLNAGERTAVFIAMGQSLIANFGPASPLYTPTNAAKVDNLNVFDGGMYAAVDPLIGADGIKGNWLGRFADKLINAKKYDRVILVPVAEGGSIINQWASGPSDATAPFPGGLNRKLTAAFSRCAALGLPVTAVLQEIGESDGQGGTTQVAFTASNQAVIAQQRALGNTAPWLIAKSTWAAGIISAPIRAACASMPNGAYIFAGPDIDTLNSTYRQGDNTHPNALGLDAMSTLWFNAWVATGL